MPNIQEEIQQLKDRQEREKSNKSFPKLNIEGEKPPKYFCRLEKQVRKSTLLDSLFMDNYETVEEEIFDQEKIEKEVKYFYQKLY